MNDAVGGGRHPGLGELQEGLGQFVQALLGARGKQVDGRSPIDWITEAVTPHDAGFISLGVE